MLWIVSGPSSAGKSTFLASPRCREITGLGPDAPVRLPNATGIEAGDLSDSFVHYNLLRPAHRFLRLAGAGKPPRRAFLARLLRRGTAHPDDAAFAQAAVDFRDDPAWRAVLAVPSAKKAVVLVAGRERIIERVRERREIEPNRGAEKSNVYPSKFWLALYARIDLPRLYRAWCDELTACGIDGVLIDSNDLEFRLRPSL